MSADNRIELVQVSPDDPEAASCRVAYFAELAHRFPGGFDPALGRAAKDIELGPPGGVFLVARRDGVAIGCGGMAALSGGVGEIKRMWTAPAARGQGVARLILRRLEEKARFLGYRLLRLDTNAALTEARNFYRREGYRSIPRYNDNPYATLWFEKKVGP
jgi:GNAT superfamily N-acetyltransferase